MNFDKKEVYKNTSEDNLRETAIDKLPEGIFYMKKISQLTSFANSSELPQTDPKRPIYRLSNNITGEHLYSPWYNEVDVLLSMGWTPEGIAWIAPITSDTPVYRLYNADLNDHLYTTDQNEIKILTSEQNWIADNNNQPVFYAGGNTPIYRLYNPENNRHLLTKSDNEYNVLPQIGWIQEDVKLKALN